MKNLLIPEANSEPKNINQHSLAPRFQEAGRRNYLHYKIWSNVGGFSFRPLQMVSYHVVSLGQSRLFLLSTLFYLSQANLANIYIICFSRTRNIYAWVKLDSYIGGCARIGRERQRECHKLLYGPTGDPNAAINGGDKTFDSPLISSSLCLSQFIHSHLNSSFSYSCINQ